LKQGSLSSWTGAGRNAQPDSGEECRFSEHQEIRVHFDWRVRAEDPWSFGTITFVHNIDTGPDVTLLRDQPKRTPSAAKAERVRQEKLYRHWEHLLAEWRQ